MPRKSLTSLPKDSHARRDEIIKRFETAQDRLVLQAADLSLETLASMVDGDAIDLRPVYQRRERWRPPKQSALIESFLLNVPVPPIYLSEEDFGVYSVIDGKQRLTSIRAFMRNQLALTGLREIAALDGYRFRDLPAALANALQVRPYLRVVTLLRQSDPELKYEVFTRLNTGGEPLNAQEVRNVVFRGPLNDLIYQLSNNAFLRAQLKILNDRSPAYRNMVDAEFVLRFLTLLESWDSFSGELAQSMDDFMRMHQHAGPAVLADYQHAFESAARRSLELWASRAFQRPVGNGWRDQALAGMYDAQMVSVARLTDAEVRKVVAHKPEVIAATRRLFEDAAFEDAVRVGTNTPSRVRYRIERMTDALRAIADS